MLLVRTTLRDLAAAVRASGGAFALGLGAAMLLISAGPAFAAFDMTTSTTTTLEDPLIGYCSGCTTATHNMVTSVNPVSDFGFTINPGPQTGSHFVLDILVPNNEAPSNVGSLSYDVNGAYTTNGSTPGIFPNGSTATLYSTTPWMSGDLSTYLSTAPTTSTPVVNDASPTNPISAFDNCTGCANTYHPGVTGFYVYQVDLGQTYLNGSSTPNVSPELNITETLQRASYIVGFLDTSAGWIATANTGAIFAKVPEPGSLALLSASLVGFGLMFGFRKRRRSVSGRRAT